MTRLGGNKGAGIVRERAVIARPARPCARAASLATRGPVENRLRFRPLLGGEGAVLRFPLADRGQAVLEREAILGRALSQALRLWPRLRAAPPPGRRCAVERD